MNTHVDEYTIVSFLRYRNISSNKLLGKWTDMSYYVNSVPVDHALSNSAIILHMNYFTYCYHMIFSSIGLLTCEIPKYSTVWRSVYSCSFWWGLHDASWIELEELYDIDQVIPVVWYFYYWCLWYSRQKTQQNRSKGNALLGPWSVT